MSIQALVDGMIAQLQRERAETQMTLGKLIAALEAMPADAEVANLNNAHSYRGYYNDLALEHGEGMRPAADLLADSRAAMGQVIWGYKGGDYITGVLTPVIMGALTPVWVASYGESGQKLMALHQGGGMETAEED